MKDLWEDGLIAVAQQGGERGDTCPRAQRVGGAKLRSACNNYEMSNVNGCN